MFSSIDTDGSGDLSLNELIPVVFPKAKPHEVKEIAAFVLDKFSRKPTACTTRIMTASQLDDIRTLFKVRARVRARSCACCVCTRGATRGAARRRTTLTTAAP